MRNNSSESGSDEVARRSAAEEALLLGAVVNAINDPVISLDGDLRVVFFNHAAETAFGYQRQTVLGQPLSSFPGLLQTLSPRSPRATGLLLNDLSNKVRRWDTGPTARLFPSRPRSRA